MSPFDREHIGELVNGSGDWFTAQLMRLIAKADPTRRALIALGFPEEVAAFEAWHRSEARDVVVAGEPT